MQLMSDLINHFVLVNLHVLYHALHRCSGTIVQTLEAKAKLWLIFNIVSAWQLLHYTADKPKAQLTFVDHSIACITSLGNIQFCMA